MSKKVSFETATNGNVRIVMTTRISYGGRITEKRQFTIDSDQLREALKKANILEVQIQQVPIADDSAKLIALSGMYQALMSANLSAYGTRLKHTVQDKLNTALGLPKN